MRLWTGFADEHVAFEFFAEQRVAVDDRAARRREVIQRLRLLKRGNGLLIGKISDAPGLTDTGTRGSG